MVDEDYFCLHMSHPDDFCASTIGTIMGHPPTINPCHTTGCDPDPGSFGMVDEMYFVFHMSHPGLFLRAESIGTSSWAIRRQSTHVTQRA
jgi:hypothetical protein